MIQGVRHIIFDLGQVLLNIDPSLTYNALRDLQIPDFEQAYRTLEEQGVFHQLETGALTATGFLDAIKSVSPSSVCHQQVKDAWNALLLDFPLRRLQILQQLQVHYDLVLLSNTNEIHEEHFNKILHSTHGIPNIGVFFDRVYYSHRIGMRKPDADIYQKVLEECSFRPGQTLFIDDLEANTNAAASLGIQTIWLKEGMTIEKDIFLSLN